MRDDVKGSAELTRTRVGDLSVLTWGPEDGKTVLALHGLTSTASVWAHLASRLPGCRVVAPDLRGRGHSARGGDPGLAQHAVDVRRVAEELGLRDVVVVGHSMGAFLAPLLAQSITERVRGLVLVDGGVPPALPALLRPAIVRLMFARELRPLQRTWPNAQAMVDKLAAPALTGRPDLVAPVLEMLGHDLEGREPALRARVDVDHAVADAVDTFFGHDLLPVLADLGLPTTLLAASQGKHDRAKPFLSDAVLAKASQTVTTLAVERVKANHLTLLFEPATAAAVLAHSAPSTRTRPADR